MNKTIKIVKYYSLYNQDQTIEAKNKLRKKPSITTTKHSSKKCKCNHPKMTGGICHNRTCRHTAEEHNH